MLENHVVGLGLVVCDPDFFFLFLMTSGLAVRFKGRLSGVVSKSKTFTLTMTALACISFLEPDGELKSVTSGRRPADVEVCCWAIRDNDVMSGTATCAMSSPSSVGEGEREISGHAQKDVPKDVKIKIRQRPHNQLCEPLGLQCKISDIT